MTVIAATAFQGKLSMSADSAMTTDDHLVICKRPKILKTNDMLIGFAGNGSMCQRLLDADYPPKKPGSTAYSYITRHVKPIIAGIETEDDSIETLIAIDNTVFSIEFGLVLEHDYYAVGSGFMLALGALYVDPSDTEKAAKAACMHNTTCQLPIFTLEFD